MTTFGVELGSHLQETQVPVPHLVTKCVKEIDERGSQIKVAEETYRTYLKY